MYLSFTAKKTKLCIKKACENSLNVYNIHIFPVWHCEFGVSFLMVVSTEVLCSGSHDQKAKSMHSLRALGNVRH